MSKLAVLRWPGLDQVTELLKDQSPGKLLCGLGLCTVASLGVSAVWQYRLFETARRDVVGDQLALTFPKPTFHVVRLLRFGVRRGVFLAAMRHMAVLRDAMAGFGGEFVYTGLSLPHMNQLSSQVLEDLEPRLGKGELRFEAVAILRFPTPDAYKRFRQAEQTDRSDGRTLVYDLGFEEDSGTGFFLFAQLFGMRIWTMLFGGSPKKAIARTATSKDSDGWMVSPEAEDCMSEQFFQDAGRQAVVLVNFSQFSQAAEDRRALKTYGFQMLAAFASHERMHGPMHLGRSVKLSGAADFDEVSVVWYPGLDYFLQLCKSEFLASVSRNPGLRDVQRIPTVPMVVPHEV